MDSPVARALLKKTLDDEVRVRTPTGAVSYCVLDISYAAPPPGEGGLTETP
jgi:transcription elongation factor GreB